MMEVAPVVLKSKNDKRDDRAGIGVYVHHSPHKQPEFGPNLEIPADPAIQLRPRPDKHIKSVNENESYSLEYSLANYPILSHNSRRTLKTIIIQLARVFFLLPIHQLEIWPCVKQSHQNVSTV